ncbi:MAG: hypothetical protein ACLUI3_12670 [Christensenellales bacterium]
MYCVRKMTEDLYWVGASERRLNLFENAYPLTNGVSYNSYLLLDEKTVLIDTVDKSVSGLSRTSTMCWAGGSSDYLIVQHMELHQRDHRRARPAPPGADYRLQRQDAHDGAELLRVRHRQPSAARQGNGHAHDRQTLLRFRRRTIALAGGHGLLRHNDQNALFGRRLGTFGALNGNLYADEVNFRPNGSPMPAGTIPTSRRQIQRRCRRASKRPRA